MTLEQLLEIMDQMVLPASTADIYNRAVKAGVAKGLNAPRERADTSSLLARMRKKDLVFSLHDDAGVLLWDMKKIKQPVRAPQTSAQAIHDEILRVNKNPTLNLILADLFDELSSSLMNAAKMLRRMP